LSDKVDRIIDNSRLTQSTGNNFAEFSIIANEIANNTKILVDIKRNRWGELRNIDDFPI